MRPVLAVFAVLALASGEVHAQVASSAPPPQEAGASGEIRFQSDRVTYASDAETVTATGNVIVRRAEQTVRADVVTWNRKTGQIEASGRRRERRGEC